MLSAISIVNFIIEHGIALVHVISLKWVATKMTLTVYDWPCFLFPNKMTVLTVDFETAFWSHASLRVVQCLYSPFFPPHIGAEPGRKKRKVQDNLHAYAQNEAMNEAKTKQCSICFNTVCLPAAACASCYAIMGCIPCVEQWHASSANASQCPLCRTSMNYVVIPILREICNLIATPVPNNEEEPGDGSDKDTIPYGVADEEALDLRPMLWFRLNSLLV